MQWTNLAASRVEPESGGAGFKLDTLLKLADVKGTDRKTSLLHFVLEQLLKEENASVGTLSTQLKSVHPAANLQVLASVGGSLHVRWAQPVFTTSFTSYKICSCDRGRTSKVGQGNSILDAGKDKAPLQCRLCHHGAFLGRA